MASSSNYVSEAANATLHVINLFMNELEGVLRKDLNGSGLGQLSLALEFEKEQLIWIIEVDEQKGFVDIHHNQNSESSKDASLMIKEISTLLGHTHNPLLSCPLLLHSLASRNISVPSTVPYIHKPIPFQP